MFELLSVSAVFWQSLARGFPRSCLCKCFPSSGEFLLKTLPTLSNVHVYGITASEILNQDWIDVKFLDQNMDYYGFNDQVYWTCLTWNEWNCRPLLSIRVLVVTIVSVIKSDIPMNDEKIVESDFWTLANGFLWFFWEEVLAQSRKNVEVY